MLIDVTVSIAGRHVPALDLTFASTEQSATERGCALVPSLTPS
jgi:hypothetical protein